MGARPFANAAPFTWGGPKVALRGFWLGLVALALLTLMLDAAVIRFFPPAPDRGETRDLWPVVQNVAHGRGYVACNPKWFPVCGSTDQVSAMHEPVPVLTYAGVAALAHDSLVAVTSVQAVVTAGTVVGIVLLTRQFGGPITSLLAGAAWAVYLPATRLVPQVAGDLFAGLWLTWGVVAFLYALRTDRKLAWVAVGVCLALGTLSRSAVLVVGPTLALGLLLWPPSPAHAWSWRLRRAVLFLAVFGAVQLPWIVRNQVALGRPVVGSTLVGYNLFREASGLESADYMRYVTADEGLAAIDEMLARRPDVTGTENEVQLDAIYRQEAVSLIAAHPLRYMALSTGRFAMLWFNWRVGGSDIDPKLGGAMGYLPDIQQALLFGAGLLGLAIAPWRRAWPLAAVIGVWCLEHMAVHAQQRYIVPLVPLVVTFAVVGGVYALQWARATRRRWSRPRLAADAPWALLVGAIPRLKQETYALVMASLDRRTPWYAKAVVVAGLMFGPLVLHGLTRSQPHLDRFIDVLPILVGLVVAHQLLPDWTLAAARRRAELALSRPGSGLLSAGIVLGWVVLATVTLGLLALDPV